MCIRDRLVTALMTVFCSYPGYCLLYDHPRRHQIHYVFRYTLFKHIYCTSFVVYDDCLTSSDCYNGNHSLLRNALDLSYLYYAGTAQHFIFFVIFFYSTVLVRETLFYQNYNSILLKYTRLKL